MPSFKSGESSPVDSNAGDELKTRNANLHVDNTRPMNKEEMVEASTGTSAILASLTPNTENVVVAQETKAVIAQSDAAGGKSKATPFHDRQSLISLSSNRRYGIIDDFATTLAIISQDGSFPANYDALLKNAEQSLEKYRSLGIKEEVDEAISYLKDALLTCPPEDERQCVTLGRIAEAMYTRYQCYKDPSDIKTSLSYCQKSLHHPLSDKANSPSVLGILAACNQIQCEGRGVQPIGEAIQHYRDILLLHPPGHSYRHKTLHNICYWLKTRYLVQGNFEDVEEAIGCNKEELSLAGPDYPYKSTAMHTLANLLQYRFEERGAVQDLDEAIHYFRGAMDLRVAGSQEKWGVLNDLATCLQARHKALGDIEDLEEAIQCNRDGLLFPSLRDIDRPSSMNNLANCLTLQFDKQGDIRLLEESIQLLRDAVTLWPAGHDGRGIALNNLALGLKERNKHQGNIQDLEEAIKCHREALVLRPRENLFRPSSLENLAACLRARYEAQGNMEDLEESIHRHREALQIWTPGHAKRGIALNNLGGCLQERFKVLGSMKDLDEAIRSHREALPSFPRMHVNRAEILNNLAFCLLVHYRLRGDAQTLEEAIQLNRESVLLRPPGYPNRSISLNDLATGLVALYKLQGNIRCLDEAIQCIRETLSLRSPGHPQRPSSLDILATCLEAQYSAQGGIHILEEAVRSVEEAILIYPSYHPSLTPLWAHLASLFADHSQDLEKSHNVKDFSSLFERAVNHPTASLKQRFDASLNWVKRQHGPSGLQAYQKCLELADHYVLVRPSVSSRYQLLTSIPHNIASDAAAHAIEDGDLKKAVEFLEQGKTLLWSQMGRYRTPLDALKDVNPDLAGEFKKLSEQLETSAASNITTDIPQQSMEEEDHKYRQIADKWDGTLGKIHQISGFEDFLQPPRFSTLQMAAQNGPIILLNISTMRSDAIIVQKDCDLLLVPLTHIQPDDITGISSEFTDAIRATQATKSARSKILAVLRSLWDDIVQPVVAKLREVNVPEGSRIWWCPASKLAMLPLHGAGPHRTKKLNLADIYISSYTPTLSALVRASLLTESGAEQTRSLQRTPNLLLVAQPETPGQLPIPCVLEELARVKETAPAVDLLLDEEGTQAAVLGYLQTHSWAHFTCHGSQNFQEPFKSCFILYDKPLTLLDIIRARLPNAEFALLSACHSAAGDKDMPEETIHLAAALQFSGFRSVIGTMYAMADVDGPLVAQEVYKHMFRRAGKGDESGGLLVDYRDAAEALNIATKVLRNNAVPVERWINFVHIGA